MNPHPLPARDDVPDQHQVVPPERGCYPPPQPLTPPHDGFLVPAVYDLIRPHVQRAHAGWVGPLPGLRTDAFLDAPDHVQLAVLLLLGSHRVFADPHQTVRALLRNVSHDIHGGDRPHWRRVALHHTRNAALVAERQAEQAAVADQPRPHDVVPPRRTGERQDPAA